MIVLGPAAQDLGPSTQHHPAEPGPVFVIPINHDGTTGFRSMLRTRLSAAPATRFGFSSMVM
jgi:hypothetical protein